MKVLNAIAFAFVWFVAGAVSEPHVASLARKAMGQSPPTLSGCGPACTPIPEQFADPCWLQKELREHPHDVSFASADGDTLVLTDIVGRRRPPYSGEVEVYANYVAASRRRAGEQLGGTIVFRYSRVQMEGGPALWLLQHASVRDQRVVTAAN